MPTPQSSTPDVTPARAPYVKPTLVRMGQLTSVTQGGQVSTVSTEDSTFNLISLQG